MSLAKVFLCAVFGLQFALFANAATTQKHYYGHDAVQDKYGVIAPWYRGRNGQYDYRVRIAAETLKRYPWVGRDRAPIAAPEFVYDGTWNIDSDGQITVLTEKDWANGDLGQRAAYILAAMIEYYRYSGDPAAFRIITSTADYLVDHCETGPSHGWPNFLISVPTLGARYGDCKLGPNDNLESGNGKIQLDIVAEVGLQVVRAYEMTGNIRWYEAAKHWADLLARKRNRDRDRAPWGRYADNAGPGMNGVQTGGIIFILSFLDELIRTGYRGANGEIVAARDAGRDYLTDVLLPTWALDDTWGRNYWDWEDPVQAENVTEFAATYYYYVKLLTSRVRGVKLRSMTESEIEKCRKRLEQFLADLLEPLGRRERRHWGSVYVRGLMLDGERKSIEPMAARLPDGNVQAMQQLIGQSPWPWATVWQRLAQRMTAELQPHPVWIIDDTGFPKKGTHSVGVARQYSGTLGKTANCQVAVSLHQATGEESIILDWRLYLPQSWIQDPQRRAAAGIPAEVKFQTKWQLALELIDEAQAWGLRCGVVLADAAYGEVTEFRQGLQARHLPYAVGIPFTVRVWTKPPRLRKARGRKRRPTVYHYGEQRPCAVGEVPGRVRGWKQVRWREGTQGWLESRFYACRVQPAHGFDQGEPPHPQVWLLVEWPPGEPAPTKYFLCDLPENYTLRRLVRIVKSRWKIEQDYQQLKEELGLDHYEGRTWTGWHHHVTLVMLAHAFLTLERLRSKKNFWVDPATDAS